jgi:hypothetical protein
VVDGRLVLLAGGVTQDIEHLLAKCKALSSNSAIAKKINKQKDLPTNLKMVNLL